jgi:GAF domain-containing protein
MNPTLDALLPSFVAATVPALLRRLRRSAPHGLWIRPAPTPVQRLDKGATLVVAHPRGVDIECRSGSLWLTHDGDIKDVVLAAGERYRSGSDRRLLVHALEAGSGVLVAR